MSMVGKYRCIHRMDHTGLATIAQPVPPIYLNRPSHNAHLKRGNKEGTPVPNSEDNAAVTRMATRYLGLAGRCKNSVEGFRCPCHRDWAHQHDTACA